MQDTKNLLEITLVSKAFPIEGGLFRQRMGVVQALKDVSFQLSRGETLAIVGGSGSGKSTLAKLIAGLLEPDSGDILWEGQRLAVMSRKDRARRIQMIFQDPFASLNPKLSVGTQLGEVISRPPNGKGKEFVHHRSVDLLEAVGLSPDCLSHYPFQFSGGQRQRIAIARALALEPALLIADEPLSALDVTIQAQMIRLLKSLKATYGLTILFITHDLAIVDEFAHRILVLQDGRVVEEGNTSDVLAHPKQGYTQALVKAVPHIKAES